MLGFNNYSDTKWIQCIFYGIHNLYCQSFLYLQATCIYINHSCNFTQTGYPSVGYVCNMCLTKKRKYMMLTQAIKFNVFDYNHFTYIFMKFSGVNDCLSICLVTLCKVLHSFCNTLRCFQQSFTVGIFTEQVQCSS